VKPMIHSNGDGRFEDDEVESDEGGTGIRSTSNGVGGKSKLDRAHSIFEPG
jgi:hypothetical protein